MPERRSERHRFSLLRLGLAALLALAAAAAPAAESPAPSPTRVADLDRFLSELATEVEAGEGHWRATYRNARVFVFAQPAHDRMRVAAPVADGRELDEAELRRLLAANYDRALDARFAITDGVLWSLFVHPLSSLTRAEFESGLKQVVTLRANWGESYASSELLFGDPN